WRTAGACLLAIGLGGCLNVDSGPDTGGCPGHYGKSYPPPTVPGVQGAYGQPMPMIAPYASAPPPNAYAAHAIMSQHVPLDRVQMSGASGVMPAAFPPPPGGAPPGMVLPPGGILSPPGVPFAPGMPAAPGGVMTANMPPGAMPGGGVIPAQAMGPPMPGVMPAQAMGPPGGGVMPAQALG